MYVWQSTRWFLLEDIYLEQKSPKLGDTYFPLIKSPFSRNVNSNAVVCDQKISKLFVSHMEESMARHMGVMEFIKS
jgi:hypothetical protein